MIYNQENLSSYSLNEVSVDRKQIWGVMTSHSRSSSCCASINNQDLANFLQLIRSDVTITISTEIHPAISLFSISQWKKISNSENAWHNLLFPTDWSLFSPLAPPHFFFFTLSIFSLYCGAGCCSIIRSLSQLKGLVEAVKNTQSHTCSARWVTAALRPRGKSLWRDAKLSYASNLHSDRLQGTKRKRGAVESAGAPSYI